MTDRRTIFVVTLALALVVLVGLVSMVALALAHVETPDAVASVTTTALGALGALLVSTRVDPAQIPAAEPSAAEVPGRDVS